MQSDKDMGVPAGAGPFAKRRPAPPATGIVERMREREADLTNTLFDFDAKIFGRGADEIERLSNLHHEMKEALEAWRALDAEPFHFDDQRYLDLAARARALTRAVLAKLQGA